MPNSIDSVPATGAVTVTSRPSGTTTSPPSERVAAAVSILAVAVSTPRRFTASGDSFTVVNSASGRGASTCAAVSADAGGSSLVEQPDTRIRSDDTRHRESRMQGLMRTFV